MRRVSGGCRRSKFAAPHAAGTRIIGNNGKKKAEVKEEIAPEENDDRRDPRRDEQRHVGAAGAAELYQPEESSPGISGP